MTEALAISQSAVQAVKEAIKAEGLPETACLRVAVKGGGCSGLSYDLTFALDPEEGDRVLEQDGVRLLLDPKSEQYLAGTELDYTSGLNGKGFVFRNPNATGTCGCGSSFAV